MIATQKKDVLMTDKLKVHSPYDGHLIKEIALDDESRIEEALLTAHNLEKSKPIPTPKRIAILNKTADLVEAREEKYARQSAEEGQKLTEFLRANPEAVEAMQNVVEKKQSDSSPPEMPEDFDSLDIYAEGTTSNDWYKEQREYERKQIIGEVVNAVQGELGARDNKQQEAQEESEYLDYLKNDEKLNDDQIKEYLEFMTNDENVTTKNMVKVWRILSGQQMENGTTDNLPPSRADEKRQVPSAAAISGSAPPKPTAQKAQDEWIDGLMEFSKKY